MPDSLTRETMTAKQTDKQNDRLNDLCFSSFRGQIVNDTKRKFVCFLNLQMENTELRRVLCTLWGWEPDTYRTVHAY